MSIRGEDTYLHLRQFWVFMTRENSSLTRLINEVSYSAFLTQYDKWVMRYGHFYVIAIVTEVLCCFRSDGNNRVLLQFSVFLS